MNQRHLEVLTFVRVQLALDFHDLNTIHLPPNTIVRGEYYLQLPQLSVQLINGLNKSYTLTTYTGPEDLCTLSADMVWSDILGITHHDGPFNVIEPVGSPFKVRKDNISSLVAEYPDGGFMR
jgi:hypothetical protein